MWDCSLASRPVARELVRERCALKYLHLERLASAPGTSRRYSWRMFAAESSLPSVPESPERIKILHLITGLGVGGAETMLHKLLAGTNSTRFESAVVSLLRLDGPLAQRIRDLGVPVESLGL